MSWLKIFRKRSWPPVKATFAGHPIRSDFVLNRLQNKAWKEHTMIIDLAKLEQYVLHGPTGCDSARLFAAMEGRYPDAVTAIEAELLPAEELASRKRQMAEAQRAAQAAREAHELKQKQTECQLKAAWLALGGKP